ncbi:MAG: tetratricopeptide repeat protein, partial [Bdellovibrionales bacterium]|nr:tetratricopeptide repeat protein [Bdellovibrionales bacterium]
MFKGTAKLKFSAQKPFKWLTVAFIGGFTSFAFAVSGEVTKIGDTTHIEFSGRAQWNYELERPEEKLFILNIEPFDEATVTRLSSWKGAHISRIKVNKNGSDGRYKVEFHVADSSVETFDYLTDDPSRVIVDFYRDEVKVAPAPPVQEKKKTVKKASGGERKPASELLIVSDDSTPYSSPETNQVVSGESGPERGIFDGSDPDYARFLMKDYEISEEAIIASRQNIYIRFPMLKMPHNRLSDLLENRPDYVIRPQDSQENKEARLLLTLSKKKRFSTFLKTYEYFTTKYPTSTYDEIVRNLAAEVHYDLYLSTKDKYHYTEFQKISQYLMENYAGSDLSERNHLLLAYSDLKEKNYTETIRQLLSYLERYKAGDEYEPANFALSESYLGMQQYDKAQEVLANIEANSKLPSAVAEAKFRQGDILFFQKKYKLAANVYKEAMQKYPKFRTTYPNGLYNLAESEFWMGRYQESLSTYVEFVKDFPNHYHGGYALTRIGELLEILGASTEKIIGALLESRFRYGDHPGSQVARIRLISQQMKGMKEKELSKSLTEIKEIAKGSPLPRMEEFTTLKIADGLHRRKEFARAVNYLKDYYQKNPMTTSLDFFRRRIANEMSDVVKIKVDSQEFIGALEYVKANSHTWLRGSDRVDIPFFVAESFEQASVLDEAERGYKEVLVRLEKMAGTQEEKERRVHEHLPKMAEVKLRLAKVSLDQRKYKESDEYLKKITQHEDLSADDYIEMIRVSAKVNERRGLLRLAKHDLEKLVENWKGQASKLGP